MLLLVHAGATLFMTGLIWFVQIVHYPLMGSIGRSEFVAYERAHTRRTTLVVGPPMLVEQGTALWLALAPPPGVAPAAAWTGLALVVAIALSTALVQVPLHRRLEQSFDERAHRLLVRSNWLRTAPWTARGLLALALLA